MSATVNRSKPTVTMRRALMRLVLVALVPLLVVETAALATWYHTRWTRQVEYNEDAARGVAAAFEDYVEDVRRQALAIGKALVELRPHSPADAARYLRSNLPDGRAVLVWNWLSPEGKLIASSEPRAANRNVAEQRYFQDLRHGASWAIGDLLPDESAGTMAFVVARRIEGAHGELLGVVSAVVDPQKFGTHVSELHRNGAGAVSIFDHRGLRVFGSDPRRAAHNNCREKDPLLAAALSSRTQQTGVLRLPEDNRDYITSRVPIQAVDGWVAGARWPVSEAMADVYAFLWAAGGISLLAAIGSAALAARTSSGLIRQLRGVQHHADAIAQGEPGHTIQGGNIRELGDLAHTFNRMGAAVSDAQQKLETANSALEDRVRERTAQLGATIRRLETEVGQRLRVEQELRGASLYARGLIEASLDPLVTISPGGKITDVNEATIAVTGASRERLIGSDFSDYFTEPERAREGYRKVLSEGLVHDYSLTIRHVDGRTIDVLYNAVVYRNEAGQVQGVFAAARDVTERNRTAAELDNHRRHLEELVEQRTGELRYQLQLVRSIADEAAESIVVTDREGRITFLNPEAQRTFQFTAEEAVGQVFHQLTHHHRPDGAPYPAAECPLHKVYTLGTTVRDHEDVFFRKDGSAMPVECSSAPLEVGGERIGGVLIVRDITERKRAAEAVEQLASYPRLNPNPITEVDLAGKVLYLNPAAERLLPGLQQRGLGHSWLAEWQQIVRPFLAGETKVLAREAVVGEECFLQTLHYSRKTGRVRIYGADITERRRAEESLKQAAEQLARSNEELEQFAYVASHDLQEPLRVISGYVQLIDHKYKGRLDADGDQFLHYILDGATRMRQLITDLLDYSRVGTRGKALQPTDLGKVLHRVQADLKGVIDDSGAIVKCGPLPTVRGDESQLARLFQNLIGNAIKFRNERTPEIDVSATRDGDHWTLAIHDNGIGIEPQYWERIFVIFQRLHTRQKYPGTGIGLAICKRIVERHGGTIWLDSQPGEGTTFYFTLS